MPGKSGTRGGLQGIPYRRGISGRTGRRRNERAIAFLSLIYIKKLASLEAIPHTSLDNLYQGEPRALWDRLQTAKTISRLHWTLPGTIHIQLAESRDCPRSISGFPPRDKQTRLKMTENPMNPIHRTTEEIRNEVDRTSYLSIYQPRYHPTSTVNPLQITNRRIYFSLFPSSLLSYAVS